MKVTFKKRDCLSFDVTTSTCHRFMVIRTDDKQWDIHPIEFCEADGGWWRMAAVQTVPSVAKARAAVAHLAA